MDWIHVVQNGLVVNSSEHGNKPLRSKIGII
jgi:hypothetical protein